MQDEALRAAGLQEEEARRPEGPGWRVWTESLEAVFWKWLRDGIPTSQFERLGFGRKGLDSQVLGLGDRWDKALTS